jgi:enoyl-CoA hydratase/carnithine racemase
LPPTAFALTKGQLREPAQQRIAAGQAMDATVQDVWAGHETLSAIREFVSRTLAKT